MSLLFIPAPTANASNLSGNTLAANVVASSLTSVGTLTSLTVAGSISITGAQQIANSSGNLSIKGANALILYGGGNAATTITGSLFQVETGYTFKVSSLGAFAAGDKYVIADASGNFHVSALGPAS